MKNFIPFIVVVVSSMTMGCQPKKYEIDRQLKGWEHSFSFRVLLHKSIVVVDKRASLVAGNNTVIVTKVDTHPMYLEGEDSLNDVSESRNLFIEINAIDTLITPERLGESKIYREILAFSTKYGISELKPDENIMITQDGNHCLIKSVLNDFNFELQCSLIDSSHFSNKTQELINESR